MAGSNIVRQITDKIATTNATPTNSTEGLATTTSNAWWIEAIIIGRDQSDSEYAYYHIGAYVSRAASEASISTVQVLAVAESTGTMDATFVNDTETIRVQVTGVAATNIDWHMEIRWQAAT